MWNTWGEGRYCHVGGLLLNSFYMYMSMTFVSTRIFINSFFTWKCNISYALNNFSSNDTKKYFVARNSLNSFYVVSISDAWSVCIYIIIFLSIESLHKDGKCRNVINFLTKIIFIFYFIPIKSNNKRIRFYHTE